MKEGRVESQPGIQTRSGLTGVQNGLDVGVVRGERCGGEPALRAWGGIAFKRISDLTAGHGL
ncbi:MAG: hypothetical protein KC592_06950 [Nitrospira sp.]|nr:hypothetical protein [Nitrospira sp.]HBP87595.1 hypothetical protein [Nitrospiraceae bacterium]HNP27914.1 hypothetical protein [Nitrospirales bacterium]